MHGRRAIAAILSVPLLYGGLPASGALAHHGHGSLVGFIFPPHIVFPHIGHLRFPPPHRARPKPKPDDCAPFRRAAQAPHGHLRWARPPKMALHKGKTYTLTFQMAGAKGKPPPAFSIVPDTAHAPRTANSFIFLACSGYYTGATFDRAIPGVLIEGGTPAALPYGGPGYAFSQEQAIGSYTRGTVVMAADGSPTEGGRFFILLGSITLPPQYTILGSLSTGMGTVDRISRAPSRQQPDAQEQTLPLQPQRIVSVSLSVR